MIFGNDLEGSSASIRPCVDNARRHGQVGDILVQVALEMF